jgi:hypothetical protein
MLRIIHNVMSMSVTPAFGSIEMATPSSTSPIPSFVPALLGQAALADLIPVPDAANCS